MKWKKKKTDPILITTKLIYSKTKPFHSLPTEPNPLGPVQHSVFLPYLNPHFLF